VSAMCNAQLETKHHHSGQRVLVAVVGALALLAALSVSPLIASAAAESNPVPAPVSNTSQHATATTMTGRGAPRVPAAAEGNVCAKCAPPLLYHAGPVMGSTPTVGEVTVTPIFWAPPGSQAFSPTYISLIDKYLTDVAAASATTANVYSVNSEYYQTTNGANTNVSYKVNFGGQQTTPPPIPAPTTAPWRPDTRAATATKP